MYVCCIKEKLVPWNQYRTNPQTQNSQNKGDLLVPNVQRAGQGDKDKTKKMKEKEKGRKERGEYSKGKGLAIIVLEGQRNPLDREETEVFLRQRKFIKKGKSLLR